MTMPPNRLDVIRVDPFFIEGERNQYANRGVAFIVLLNGAAAIVLLAILAQPLPSTGGLKAIADAMLVFSIGAVLGLTSALLAYLNRTFRLDQPDDDLATTAALACCRGRSRRCRLFLGGNEYGPDRRAPSDFYLLTQGDPATQEYSTSKAAHRAGQAKRADAANRTAEDATSNNRTAASGTAARADLKWATVAVMRSTAPLLSRRPTARF
jgi:hypothetical protein